MRAGIARSDDDGRRGRVPSAVGSTSAPNGRYPNCEYEYGRYPYDMYPNGE